MHYLKYAYLHVPQLQFYIQRNCDQIFLYRNLLSGVAKTRSTAKTCTIRIYQPTYLSFPSIHPPAIQTLTYLRHIKKDVQKRT